MSTVTLCPDLDCSSLLLGIPEVCRESLDFGESHPSAITSNPPFTELLKAFVASKIGRARFSKFRVADQLDCIATPISLGKRFRLIPA